MKSVVCYGRKDIKIEEVDTLSINADEVMVSISAGGICGSDLHYYNHGGFGTIRIKEPLTLGHEVAGYITELGESVEGLKVGDLVAINPSQPCGECQYCRKAHYNQCINMRYYGSAQRYPHVQGAFSQNLRVQAKQCHVLSEGITAGEGAFCEPLAVVLHAISRTGNLAGKRVLVTGVGPIGALVVAVAKLHGALEVVATDIVDEALKYAREVGADRTINITTNGKDLAAFGADKGYFDVVVEASGNEKALHSGLDVIVPRGRLIQLGLGGDVNFSQNIIVTKEIEICGSFRFHEEFAWAAELINTKRILLQPLLTDIFPFEEAVAAFEAANDRKKNMKVQLSFD